MGSIVGTISNLFPKLSISKEDGGARILESSSMSVRSGDKAYYHSGGELGIPVSQSSGAVTLTFKRFGIVMEVTPISQGENLSLNLDIEVSSPTTSTGGYVNFKKSQVATVQYCKSADSVAIGGLISARDTKTFDAVPSGVSDALIQLYASEDFRRQRSQFVVFVTPAVLRGAREAHRDLKGVVEDSFGSYQEKARSPRRRSSSSSHPGGGPAPGRGRLRPAEWGRDLANQRAAVLVVAGMKGGVGKSFLALNFTLALLRETKGRVVAVDFDPVLGGDLAQAAGLVAPKRSLAELAPLAASLTPALLKGFLDLHPSGLAVLTACREPGQAAGLAPRAALAVLEVLAQAFDLVVVDAPHGFTPFGLAALEASTHLLLPLTPDPAAVGHTRRGLDLLRQMAFPRQAVSVVLNRCDPKGAFGPAAVAAGLEREIKAVIPDDPLTVARSLANGTPLILAEPRHPISRALDELAGRLWSEGALAPGPARGAAPLSPPAGLAPSLAPAAAGGPAGESPPAPAAPAAPGQGSGWTL